jgi:hypothetical protein
LIKLDFSPIKKCYYKKLSQKCFLFNLDWIKSVQMDQSSLNCIFSEPKMYYCRVLSYLQRYENNENILDQIGSN